VPNENPNDTCACAGVARNKKPNSAEAFNRFRIKNPSAIALPPKKPRFQASVTDVSTQPERLSLLFDTHEDKLYRLARRLTRSAEEAEDLLQDTFVKAAGALGSIPDGGPNEEARLVRVLINTQRDQWRKAAVRKRTAAITPTLGALPASTAEAALIAKRAVWAALDTLTPRRRAILVLSELEGLAPDAIATLVGGTVVTVRWHLSMGRRELRRALASHMGETS
jgi:RNA polymerase sigma-70 factor, ECF subfamily